MTPPPPRPISLNSRSPSLVDFLGQGAGRETIHCTPPLPSKRRKNPGCVRNNPEPPFPAPSPPPPDVGMICNLNSWVRLLNSLCHPRLVSLNPRIQASNSHLFGPCFLEVLPFPISGWAARDRGEAEVERTWAPPPTPSCSKSGGDCDPQSYHTGAPGQVRTRARQRKVVLVRVSAPMGVFVCLRFCTYVYEPRGVWVGCIRGNKPDVSSETGTPSVLSFYEDA